jgi:hypothetical protein
MMFQRLFPQLIYAPGFDELAVAILRRAVLDLRSPCRRQDALDWFESGRCCWVLDGLEIRFDCMMVRVDDVLALPMLENRRWGKRKARSRVKWKRDKRQISG